MTRLSRPLDLGQPLTLWRHSAVSTELFDVADRPMHGEMDPFFFLTKEKNFIPHEYPCRTDFADIYRDKRPDERETAAPDTVWLGFGSPRLDLSGFWFRATRLAARAETLLVADTAGEATLRLATCGGAILRVNGIEVLWTAAYRRNFEGAEEVKVALEAGENLIEVFFDDLAERDTRFYIQLDYVNGPKAHQAIAVDCEPAEAEAIEHTLTTMHFERASYDGTEVRLILPTPLGINAHVEVKVEGDFMSHDPFPPMHRDLGPETTAIVVGQANDLPADFRHFVVSFTAGGFTATRTFGTEISHANLQGEAPATQSLRIEEALHAVADGGEADTVRALARLAVGKNDALTVEMIEAALKRIDACWDCADFALVPLIWSRTQWPDLLGPEFCARIDQTILGYRYWMDEPGNDVQWYFSENHALLFHTAAHLGGALLPDATFVRSGRTGREQSQVGLERLRAWFDHFEQWEMAEFNSAPYFPIDLKGMTAIFALSPDAELRERAGRAILRLLEVVANSAHQGILTAAQGRSYEHTLRGTVTLELSAMARLLWGRGSYGTRFHTTPQLALCLRDHGLVAPDLTERACIQGDQAQEWNFAQGEGKFARLYHHKSPDHAMGSTVAYRWGDWGYQETLIHARLGDCAEAQIWINHPGEVIHSGYGRPSYWGGSASVPRVQQYRDLAIVRFNGVAPQPDFTHAWFPLPDFDHAQVNGDTALAGQAGAHVILRGSDAFKLVQEGPTAGHELRLAGRDNWFILRLGSTALHGDSDAFAARFGGITLTETGETITVDDPDYGTVTFKADGSIAAAGRSIDPSAMTVQGTRAVLPRGPLGSAGHGAV